jgi:hypothetical protein
LGRPRLCSGLRLPFYIELQLLHIQPSRHCAETVTDMSPMRGTHQARTMRA